MSKIKAIELKKVVKELKLIQQDDIKIVDFNGLKIEVNQYLPITEKIRIVSSIYESAVDTDNGLHIVDGNSLDIAFKIIITESYTNLTLPQVKGEDGKLTTDIIGSYDMLTTSRLYDFIYESIPKNEIAAVEVALYNHTQAKQDEYEQKNTIQYIVKDLLSGLINKLPSKDEAEEFIKMASKEISNFDPEKMKFVKDAIGWNKGENIG